MNRTEEQIARAVAEHLAASGINLATEAGVVRFGGAKEPLTKDGWPFADGPTCSATMALNHIMNLGGDPNGTEYEVEVVVRTIKKGDGRKRAAR